MYGSFFCNVYIEGLDAFIDFVKKYMLDNIRENLCCPCKHCKNENKYRTDDVLRPHLIEHGFMENNHREDALNKVEMRDSYLDREVPTDVEE
jgi:hypothetical protein